MSRRTDIMAIDLGSQVGICYGDTDDGVDIFEGVDLSRGCFFNQVEDYSAIYKSRQDKLCQFRQIIGKCISDYRPDVVVFERPFVRGMGATRMLWGMAGVLESFQEKTETWDENGKDYYYTMPKMYDVAVTTIKKFATGSGRASKEEMIEAAKNILGNKHKRLQKTMTDHEADAICLFQYFKETQCQN